MGGPTLLLWTVSCPWRPPNVILRSSREHFWEMFLIRTQDDCGSEDRSCTIDNSCSWVGCAMQARHRRYGGWFDTTPKHYRRLLLAASYTTVISAAFFVKYPPILGLKSFGNTKVNHTCFDGTVKYYQPPHNFYLFCTLEIFLWGFSFPVDFCKTRRREVGTVAVVSSELAGKTEQDQFLESSLKIFWGVSRRKTDCDLRWGPLTFKI